MSGQGLHTLVVYRASPSADATLRELARPVNGRSARLTVLALAVQERPSHCCNTRSVLWNGYQLEFARDHLDRARQAVTADAEVEFDVLAYPSGRAADAVLEEARRRGADEVVLADPRTSGLTRRERRRLC